MHNEASSIMKLQLRDVNDDSDYREIELEIESHGIAIRPAGYGDKLSADGQGSPVFIEIRNGTPVVVIWEDINNEEPSHQISLERAVESNRREK